MSLRESFLTFDDHLAAKGVPPLTAWWRDGLGEWLDAYETGDVMELWACVGRGAAKSTALYKLALFFTLFVDSFETPVGERHFAIILSRVKEEAAKGVGVIARWLTMMNVAYRLAGDVIELVDLPRGIRVVAASVAATSGWRAYFIGKDERSKWSTSDLEERDADEIDTSAAAMTATHARAPIVSVGSAWGAFGCFYDAITQGSTAARTVLGPAATWVAAPHVDPASLRRKERDPRRFAREYECVFQSGASAAFATDEIASMFRFLRYGAEPLGRGALFIDSSSGRGDGWAFGIAQHIVEPCGETIYLEERIVRNGVYIMTTPVYGANGRPIPNPKYTAPAARLHIDSLGVFDGEFARSTSFAEVVAHIATIGREYGMSKCYGDQYLAFSLTSEFARHGMTFIELPWTAPAKVEAAATLRRLLREGSIVVEPCSEADKLKTEIGQLQERFTPSGALTIAAHRTAVGHADLATMTLLIARAESEGAIAGSPIARDLRRGEYDPYGSNNAAE